MVEERDQKLIEDSVQEVIELEHKLIEYFRPDEEDEFRGKVSVRCLFHDDSRPSAVFYLDSLNMFCSTCAQTYSKQELFDKINSKASEPKQEIKIDRSIFDIERAYNRFIYDRKLDKEKLTEIGVYAETRTDRDSYGFLVVPYGCTKQQYGTRNLREGGQKANDSTGNKGLLNEESISGETHILLCEGVSDYLTLRCIGFNNVVGALGAHTNGKILYPLRGKTVFILFDDDYTGFSEARKTAIELKKLEANPIILEFPRNLKTKEQGKTDVSSCFVKYEDSFTNWLKTEIEKGLPRPVTFETAFGESEKIISFPTGLATFDSAFNGAGFMSGIHGISAETSLGKSTYAAFFAGLVAGMKGNCLYATYELDNRQMWSRIAAQSSRFTWNQIELDPSICEPHVKEKINELSKHLTIVSGFGINKIKSIAEKYDVIIIDYLQQMPAPLPTMMDKRLITETNFSGLVDIRNTMGKVILLISSIPRAIYSKKNSIEIFKESGDVEYGLQSGTRIWKDFDGNMSLVMVKNTRGPLMDIPIEIDYGHSIVKEKGTLI